VVSFTPRERTCSTCRLGGWLYLRAGQNIMKKRNLLNLPGIELQIFQPSDYSLWNIVIEGMTEEFSGFAVCLK
jgi:hypothetical protein